MSLADQALDEYAQKLRRDQEELTSLRAGHPDTRPARPHPSFDPGWGDYRPAPAHPHPNFDPGGEPESKPGPR
jgi:hypothetical protein